MGMECMETIAHAWVCSIARDVERARGEREGWTWEIRLGDEWRRARGVRFARAGTRERPWRGRRPFRTREWTRVRGKRMMTSARAGVNGDRRADRASVVSNGFRSP